METSEAPAVPAQTSVPAPLATQPEAPSAQPTTATAGTTAVGTADATMDTAPDAAPANVCTEALTRAHCLLG